MSLSILQDCTTYSIVGGGGRLGYSFFQLVFPHVQLNDAAAMISFRFLSSGIMDNFVMISAGDLIDSTLGVKLGLATLTAAACGQVVRKYMLVPKYL